jgi:methylated-DNA-protein-cysteine methyltransferase-like protein
VWGAAPPRALTPFEAAVVAAVRALQPGEVVSYGEVARRAGWPRRARAVGNVLAGCESLGVAGDLPWWRVVYAGGRLSAPDRREQRRRLLAEGVEVVDDRVLDGMW